MIQNMSLHQAKHMIAAIDGVVRAHHAALETITFLKENVTFLKEKVQALEGHNQGLSDRVAVLEQSSRCCLQEWVGRRKATDVDVAERSEKKLFDDEERTVNQISTAHDMRVAQEKQAAAKRAAEVVANQKRIADRCGELLKKNAQFPLHQGAQDGDCNEVLDHFLLKLKFHVDTKNNIGETPLHWAAWKGHSNVVQHLLDRGAGIDTKNNDGDTPLRLAEEEGHADVVALLKSKGRSV